MSAVAWEVRFCTECCRAFDIRTGVRACERCPDCRRERKRESDRRRLARNPRRPKNRCTLPPESWMEARRLEGATYRQIAAEAGMSHTTILRRFQRSL